MTDEEARQILGLTQGVYLNPGRIKRAWKAAAICTHPDRGGTAEAFVRASEAAKLLNHLGGVPRRYAPTGRSPERPTMQLLGPMRPRPRDRPRMDPGYWSRQRDLESFYGTLGNYGRDGLMRTWYRWHRRRRK